MPSNSRIWINIQLFNNAVQRQEKIHEFVAKFKFNKEP